MTETRVRSYYDLVDRGDITRLVQLFAEDAVYQRPGYPPIRGRGELERFYREERVIKSGRHTVESVMSSPSRVAVTGSFAGTLHGGQDVTLRFADFFNFGDDGKFSRRDTYFFTPLV
ncbi:nuclear transport factor 2 family protein [Micromonospora aurantiaca]|nr:nuclear transport factor 2 family protein [Micromonospora aurantiaca]